MKLVLILRGISVRATTQEADEATTEKPFIHSFIHSSFIYSSNSYSEVPIINIMPCAQQMKYSDEPVCLVFSLMKPGSI